jgi:AcrR family transcriptional regulator
VEFGAKGFDGAYARHRRRIGAHQPQINYHFASKDALGLRQWTISLPSCAYDARARSEGARCLDRDVSEIAALVAEMIRRFVHFAARHPELNRIMVHEATSESGRLTWMTERHVKPLYDLVRPLWRRLRKAAIAAPIDDKLFHYVLVGAASLAYVNAPEARLLTGIEPTARAWVEAHAEGLVATLLPNAPKKARKELAARPRRTSTLAQ